MIDTPLDRAHAAMEAEPSNSALRLRFYERLAETELMLMLSAEPEGETVVPDIFPLQDARYALVFDTEDRLAAFAGAPVPYAALSGRAVAAMLAGSGVGLGLNLDAGSSAMLLPADAVDWLAETLGEGPQEIESRLSAIHPPGNLPEALLAGLDAKLAVMTGLARSAYLVGTEDEKGARGHLLAFVDARPGAEQALARAAHEALAFSGLDHGMMDVGFFDRSDTTAAALARHGLRIDLDTAEAPGSGPSAPGMDPAKPPILR